MNDEKLQATFNQQAASAYDSQWARLAPFRDGLHLLVAAVLAELPVDARILCVGAGTGAEILSLAEKFPGWHFTAVEPSAPMLDVFRRKAQEQGIASRCTFHEGYLDSLPQGEPFDAATSLLVSHFILQPDERVGFFGGIRQRLRPDGILINSDLTSDTEAPHYGGLLEVWMRTMAGADLSQEKQEQMRAAYRRDVAILAPEKIARIIVSGGFDTPVQFYQCGLIHGWFARAA
ncbi:MULTISPECIES: class I SAM-dependent methyltransferase [unclassified Herbaspirillum]|uniref:class I SAM-dependent methyltransferase n=1 Tax=unclassified Herbaspirillum TaxID=2624150 RepID=UPI000E2F0515|nr:MULTISPECIES: class I SAM-dependent methyltransferase [unclassified Herbaspirillum]RFB68624.1 class I SAM-dependent methyltransferase [Herbaspirillum sp. 3R-3a1]TFI05531.1 class I SAM-dependent methyltransferase [Herbaspirillum sp. 3R11]TFI13559.1 class I SAM-dependent methyltransferase [Herbaspirillum sp. 3R-11]TFI25511.1 class I SAM-dependent methyltransferase [Herbaspirillum sp. 3C11]